MSDMKSQVLLWPFFPKIKFHIGNAKRTKAPDWQDLILTDLSAATVIY